MIRWRFRRLSRQPTAGSSEGDEPSRTRLARQAALVEHRHAETIARLPILAAVAAHHALSRIGVADARIKWPNDILVDGCKIAGILVFASHGETSWVTVGLGVNLETAPVIDNGDVPRPTSVADHVETGTPEEWREEIVCDFINQLDRLMNDPTPAFESWRALLTQMGHGELIETTAEHPFYTG